MFGQLVPWDVAIGVHAPYRGDVLIARDSGTAWTRLELQHFLVIRNLDVSAGWRTKIADTGNEDEGPKHRVSIGLDALIVAENLNQTTLENRRELYDPFGDTPPDMSARWTDKDA